MPVDSSDLICFCIYLLFYLFNLIQLNYYVNNTEIESK